MSASPIKPKSGIEGLEREDAERRTSEGKCGLRLSYFPMSPALKANSRFLIQTSGVLSRELRMGC